MLLQFVWSFLLKYRIWKMLIYQLEKHGCHFCPHSGSCNQSLVLDSFKLSFLSSSFSFFSNLFKIVLGTPAMMSIRFILKFQLSFNYMTSYRYLSFTYILWSVRMTNFKIWDLLFPQNSIFLVALFFFALFCAFKKPFKCCIYTILTACYLLPHFLVM